MSGNRTGRQLGWAKISLGLSVLFAAVALVYFVLQGRPIAGFGLGIVVILGGVWEYRRRLQDLRAANRYEAKADDHRQRRRE